MWTSSWSISLKTGTWGCWSLSLQIYLNPNSWSFPMLAAWVESSGLHPQQHSDFCHRLCKRQWVCVCGTHQKNQFYSCTHLENFGLAFHLQSEGSFHLLAGLLHSRFANQVRCVWELFPECWAFVAILGKCSKRHCPCAGQALAGQFCVNRGSAFFPVSICWLKLKNCKHNSSYRSESTGCKQRWLGPDIDIRAVIKLIVVWITCYDPMTNLLRSCHWSRKCSLNWRDVSKCKLYFNKMDKPNYGADL